MARRATVLVYHGVGRCPHGDALEHMFVNPEDFRRQLDYLVQRRTVVTLERALSGASAVVALTFDDAYQSFFQEALPALEARGLPATLFVPTGRLGESNTWDEETGCPARLMTPEEVADAARRGIEIGSHGHMHVDLTACSAPQARSDLAQSIDALRELTGSVPRFLAYPWGRHSKETRELARSLAFEAAFAVNGAAPGPFGRPRVQIDAGDGDRTFALKTSGLYETLRRSRAVRLVRRAIGA